MLDKFTFEVYQLERPHKQSNFYRNKLHMCKVTIYIFKTSDYWA